MNGIALLRKYGIEFNVLVTVTDEVSRHPLEVHHFLKQQRITHVQFNPVVERIAGGRDQSLGLTFAQQ